MLFFVICFISIILIIYATIFKKLVKHDPDYIIRNTPKWNSDYIIWTRVFWKIRRVVKERMAGKERLH